MSRSLFSAKRAANDRSPEKRTCFLRRLRDSFTFGYYTEGFKKGAVRAEGQGKKDMVVAIIVAVLVGLVSVIPFNVAIKKIRAVDPTSL